MLNWHFFKRIIVLGFVFLQQPHGLSSDGSTPISTSQADQPKLELQKHSPPPRHDQCQLCHIKKNQLYIRKKKILKKEHPGISLIHGRLEMSCNGCHDINNHNYLRASTSLKASFENPSPVCQRCHAEKYRDWLRGTHGKRIGGWNQTKTQLHCTDCHNHHSVKFKPMESVRLPVIPRFGIIKSHSPGHEE